MKARRTEIRRQQSEGRCRRVAAGGVRSPRRGGFTLVEVLLAVSISVIVFGAMGMVLSKSFSLWKDASAHWRLAQYSRIARERILRGGFADPIGGLMGATNAVVVPYSSNWDYIEYQAKTSGVRRIWGWTGSAEQDIWLYDDTQSPTWSFAQGMGYPTHPSVRVDSFDAVTSNQIVMLTYRLRFSAAGKIFTQPHTIRAYLVNEK